MLRFPDAATADGSYVRGLRIHDRTADATRAFSSDSAGPVIGYLLLSLSAISVAAGVVALAWPDITALALTLWVAAWALVTGVMEIALTFRAGEKAGQRAMWVLGGLVSIGLGVVLFIRPDIGAASLATVFGLFCIVYGTSTLVLVYDLRNAKSSAQRLLAAAA
jgi:uncharacterized membrane protein HdeD (DUF308 family)